MFNLKPTIMKNLKLMLIVCAAALALNAGAQSKTTAKSKSVTTSAPAKKSVTAAPAKKTTAVAPAKKSAPAADMLRKCKSAFCRTSYEYGLQTFIDTE